MAESEVHTEAPSGFVTSGDQKVPTVSDSRIGTPMMGTRPGGRHMMGGPGAGMPMMDNQHSGRQIMQEQMRKMESHLSNIEALLEELVEMQKKLNSLVSTGVEEKLRLALSILLITYQAKCAGDW